MSVKDEILIRSEFGYSERVIPKARPNRNEVSLIETLDEQLADNVTIVTNADYRLFKNRELKDREIDCIIRCKDRIWIVDLKYYQFPVTVYKSDQWEVDRRSSIEWHDNPLTKILNNAKEIKGALRNFRGKVLGYVVFNDSANIDYEPDQRLKDQVFRISKLINIVNEYAGKTSNKTDDYSESFANFVSKCVGYNRPIRVFCPRYPDLKVEIEETSSSDHYARGLLSEKHRDTKTPQYYFVRFHTELLDPGLLEQLAELGERIKVYKDDLDLGNLSGLRLPEIFHDDANLCVWFIYSLRSLDKSSGELYFRKKLFSYLKNNECPVEIKMKICLQLLEYFEALHGANFSHRLLSPDSLWINENSKQLSLFGFECVKFSTLEFSDRTITGLTAKLRSSIWNPVEYDSLVQFNHADHFKGDVYSAALLISAVLCDNPSSILSDIGVGSRSDRELVLKSSISGSVSESYPGLIRLLEKALDSDAEKRLDIESFKDGFQRLLSGQPEIGNKSISEIKPGDVIDDRYEIERDLVPQANSVFKVLSAIDLTHNSHVILKFSSAESHNSELDVEVENIRKIRDLSKFKGEIAGVELPEILASIDLSNDYGLKYYVRKYFDVQPAEKVSASSLDIFKNLEKLVRFVCSLHQNNFCIRDICNSNVRWDKNGNLVILDLGSVCRIDDPDRAFNGKEDFLPLLPRGERSTFEKDKHRKKRDCYATLLTCFRWFFGQRPWESSYKVEKPDDIQIDWSNNLSDLGETEEKLIKDFFESSIGRPSYDQYQYIGDIKLLSSIREVVEELDSRNLDIVAGPIENLQGFIFDEPVDPQDLALTPGVNEIDDRIGYLLSCAKDSFYELFESVVQDCLEIHRDHQSFDIIRDTSRDESCLALLILNSQDLSEGNFLSPFEASSSLFSDAARSAISLLDKVSGTDLSIYWSEDRFWVLPNKILKMIGLLGSSLPPYLQLHDQLSCFAEYSLNADDYPDSLSYREALVELRDALLNPSAFPTEKFGQLVLPDGHFFPSAFEVVFGSDDVSGKQVILLSCGWDSGGELYSSLLAQLKTVNYRYRLFTVSENNDSDYGMGLLESTISLSSYPEDLQAAIDSDEFTNVTIGNCISFLEDIGDLAHSDSYILMFVESDFRIVPSALLSKIGIHTPVSVLGDQCLDMLRKVSSLPEEVSDWTFDTLSQLKDHVRFLNDLEDRGDEWRVVLDELPWEEVQGYLTYCMEKQAGPFRTHDMYAYPDEAKLGAGASGTVYRTLPDGLVLKIANTSKSVEGNPGGIEEEKWNREVALHERVRGYSLPGLTQFINEERGFMYFRCDPGETLKSRFESGVTFSDFVSLVSSFKDYLSSLHKLAKNHDIFATDICPDNIIVVDDGSTRGPRCIHIDLGPGYHPFWSPPEEDFSGGVNTKPLNGMMYSFSKVLAGEVLLMGSANRSVLDDWYQFAITCYSEFGSLDTHDLVYSNGHRADVDEVWRNLEGELTRSLVEVCNVGQSRLNEVLPRILKFFRSGLNPDLNDRFINLQQMNEELQSFRSFLLESR
ncbi:MAG: NERD domain-containing protein [Planctomycetia bacterium]|nr:NERD domain-containing protein [Planctomycetia bacterium]